MYFFISFNNKYKIPRDVSQSGMDPLLSLFPHLSACGVGSEHCRERTTAAAAAASGGLGPGPRAAACPRSGVPATFCASGVTPGRPGTAVLTHEVL